MRILRTFIVAMALAALTAACGGKSTPATENTGGGDDMGTDMGGDAYGGDMYGDDGMGDGMDDGMGDEGDGME